VVLISAAVVGCVALARGAPGPRAMLWLVALLAVCFSAGQAVFYIGGRHRWTIEPVLGLLSATGVWWLWQRARGDGMSVRS
jgi:hypothetical protein